MAKKGFVALAASLVMALGATHAMADTQKGQKFYLKTCKQCHGTGTKGAAMHTQAEWDEVFANDGEKFIKGHEGVDGAERMLKFFPKIKDDLYDFLHFYGKDSGNVPSCG